MSKIIIIGLGPGNPKYLTREAQKQLLSGKPLYFRTFKHPSARYYAARGRRVFFFDRLYDRCSYFEQVYRIISGNLVRAARHHGTICYAVPGHPLVGEATVQRLLRICPRLKIKLQIVDGMSFIEPLFSRLRLDLFEGVTILDALALERLKEPCRNYLVIAQVYNRSLASRVKLRLLELYSPEHPVLIVKSAGMPGERFWKMPLHAIDRKVQFDHFTTICLLPSEVSTIYDLLGIMARLRAEDGCPWDRQQTHHSLRQYLVEEAYEVVSAIDSGDDQSLCDELGDLLLQVVFHSQIAGEENRFDFSDVVDLIIAKMIRRHPHVFGKNRADNAHQVKTLWEQVKAGERIDDKERFLLSVDHSLPALLKAYKLQKRAADGGFDWPCIKGPLEKVREELLELEEACINKDQAAVEEELGDFLFTVVNIARFLGVNPELALGKTIGKFTERFRYVINQAEKKGRPLSSFSLEELDQWWEEAKKIRKISN